MSFISIDPQHMSVAELHAWMLSTIVPRPIAFASTVDAAGNVNLSPFSFFNAFGSNPPTLIFSPARRVRDNTTKHTLENVMEVPEVVIHIVSFDNVEQMSLSSTEYEKGVNEFIKSGFTPLKSHLVKPPRVKECKVSYECAVRQVIPLGNEGGAGSLIICEILLGHVDESILDSQGRVDPRKLDAVGRLGGDWYIRSINSALFELEKPVKNKGIGVDALPDSARNSHYLSGNDLGKLGNVQEKPNEEQIANFYSNERFTLIRNFHSEDQKNIKVELHRLAHTLLSEGDSLGAWCAILWFDKWN